MNHNVSKFTRINIEEEMMNKLNTFQSAGSSDR
jgi:hypothetical protein